MRSLLVSALLVSAACGSRPLADGLPSPVTCSSCHGDAESPAPPRGVKWESAPTAVEVGAHRLHLRDTPIRNAVGCSDCHIVPTTVDAHGHVDGTHATVTFSPLATFGETLASAWNRDEVTCSKVYCHGATLPGGSATAPLWTYQIEPDPARPAPEICGTCHSARPAAPHPQLGPCSACHPATVRADGAIDTAGGKHIDGAVQEASALAACGTCHPVPGASGAHAAHYSDASLPPLASYGDTRAYADYGASGVAGYLFGCGNCHPLDAAKHMDGVVDVELGSGGAPAGSLKARNGSGATIAADKTCSAVYCHSSGQASPAYTVTPAWNSGTQLGCDGCHANPPRYASGAAGGATANTHLQLRSTTSLGVVYAGGWGHYAWHNRTRTVYTQNLWGQHGVTSPPPASPEQEVADGTFGAAPMTCQTCHYDTVDPAATGPSGYWWLNTTGDYDLPGRTYAPYACATALCHDNQPGLAPTGNGGVLPLRHVNGVRDVIFDPRTTPSTYGTPTDPAAPVYPYWVELNAFKDGLYLPPGAAFTPAPPADGSATAGTVSFRLDIATWDPVTKSCGNVACHLRQTAVQWGGTGLGTYSTCFSCHTSH